MDFPLEKKNMRNIFRLLTIEAAILIVVLYPLAMMPLGGSSLFLNVTVFTNKVSYIPDENVTIFGNLTFNGSPVQQNGLVGLQVNDTTAPIFLRTVAVGPYSMAPTVSILSVTSCDYYLKPKSSFNRGDEAYFYVVVKNNDINLPHHALITASIFEGLNRPLTFPSTYELDMNPGSIASARFGPVLIPTWSWAGEAKVYANVFSGWPRNQGIPWCPEKSASFTIIGLEFERSSIYGSANVDAQVTSYNYQLTVGLSPESKPGQYRIDASANYGGWKSYSIVTFTVPIGPYSPKASFEYIPRPESWVGCNMTFDGSTSVAVGYEDYITKYKWNFGDGTPIQDTTTPKITKAYSANGTYPVTLNVTDNQNRWNTTSKLITVLTEKRDIAITKLESLTEIYADWIVNVTVTVKSFGGPSSETFNLRLLYNSTLLQTYNITNLAPWPNGVATLTFTWNTTGLTPYVIYVLKGEADILTGETNTTNNVRTVTISKVKMLGDVTGDKKINIYDVVSVAVAYGSKPGDAKWNVQADLIRNNLINIFDVVAVTSKYGKKYPG